MNWTFIGGAFLVVAVNWAVGYGLRVNMGKTMALNRLVKQLGPGQSLNAKGLREKRRALGLSVLFGILLLAILLAAIAFVSTLDLRWYWMVGVPLTPMFFAWLGYTGRVPGISLDL